jgi:hypothetical protein
LWRLSATMNRIGRRTVIYMFVIATLAVITNIVGR